MKFLAVPDEVELPDPGLDILIADTRPSPESKFLLPVP